MKNKQYWFCLIGGVPKEELYFFIGADSILRKPVREAFYEAFGDDEVCASGWGIDEERYQLLRKINIMPTEQLKSILASV